MNSMRCCSVYLCILKIPYKGFKRAFIPYQSRISIQHLLVVQNIYSKNYYSSDRTDIDVSITYLYN